MDKILCCLFAMFLSHVISKGISSFVRSVADAAKDRRHYNMSCFNVPYCVGSFKLCHMAQHAHPVSGGLISFRIGSNKSIQFIVSYLELGIWKIIISVMEMLL